MFKYFFNFFLRKKNQNIKIDKEIYMPEKDYNLVQGLKLQFVSLKDLDVKDINSEWSLDYQPIFDKYRRLILPENPYSIINSPHYAQAISLITSKISSESYLSYIKETEEISRKTNLYNGQLIQKKGDPLNRAANKVESFKKLLHLLQSQAYPNLENKGGYVIVLDRPLAHSRFGKDLPKEWQGYEILSGHHRSAILAALGQNKIKCLVFTDKSEKKISLHL